MNVVEARITDNNHLDLLILCNKTHVSPDGLRQASRGFEGTSYQGNYLKVYYLRDWDGGTTAKLKREIAEANEVTTEYRFELMNTIDYEMEYDHDNSHPAGFAFLSYKK